MNTEAEWWKEDADRLNSMGKAAREIGVTIKVGGGSPPDMSTITLYSWGYWGWGTSTDKLVEAVDAAEKRRGRKPLYFVDIRYRRTGRAPGFVGDAFRDTVGRSRYCHKEHLQAAIDAGCAEVFIPKENDRDVQMTPDYVRNKIGVRFVSSIDEVLAALLN